MLNLSIHNFCMYESCLHNNYFILLLFRSRNSYYFYSAHSVCKWNSIPNNINNDNNNNNNKIIYSCRNGNKTS